jgi:hypothetical protein
MIITFAYVRPRRARRLAEVVDEEPAYVTYPDQLPPHLHTRREYDESRPVPGRYLDDRLD